MLVETPSGRIEVERFGGDGPAAVYLLAGALGGMARLRGLAEQLVAAGLRVCIPRGRGSGLSEGTLEEIDLHDLAGDVIHVIRALEDGPVALVGVAFGNRLARCVASDDPALVSRLVLIGAGGRVPPEPEAARALAFLLRPGGTEEERVAAARTALLGPDSPVPPGELAVRPGGAASVAWARAGRCTPVEQWWAGGQAPMLVLQGSEDRIAPVGNGRALRDEHPERVQLVEFEGAGHALLLERFDAVAQAVVEALRPAREAR